MFNIMLTPEGICRRSIPGVRAFARAFSVQEAISVYLQHCEPNSGLKELRKNYIQ